MARKIEEIKQEMVEAYTTNTTVKARYNVADGDALTLSKVSIENIFFYVVAACVWTLEVLFDKHKQEVTDYIDEMKPHTLRWYVNKAKAYRHGYTLVEGTDGYAEDLSDDELDAALVVKNAAAVEENAIVYLKVASGTPAQLSATEEAGLTAYMKEVKDAGVVLRIRNVAADHYRATLKIWYNPMVLDSEGGGIVSGGEPVRECVRNFLASLPFNGEYRNDSLIDAVQAVDGVVMVELVMVQTCVDGSSVWNEVCGYAVPYAGYYNIAQDSDLTINYMAYETVSN
ncbi:MAG TPA: hypothetical protein PKW49_03250 [Paludibacteraceae bacterium]|nr:hypothetical protein [Paludibacteraceae bacterium]